MFKFLKEKLSKAVSIFSKKVEEEADIKKEEVAIEPIKEGPKQPPTLKAAPEKRIEHENHEEHEKHKEPAVLADKKPEEIKHEKKHLEKKHVHSDELFITYFVHGTTTDNEEGKLSGHSHAGLSHLGMKQSIDLRDQLRYEFGVIFSSDLKRATESAELTWPERKIIHDKRLRECDYGELTGKKDEDFNEFRAEYNPISRRFPGGECFKDVEKRLRSFLNDAYKDHKGEHIAIVAHRYTQLAIEVLLQGKTWDQVLRDDWRLKHAWQPGWDYVMRHELEEPKEEEEPETAKKGFFAKLFHREKKEEEKPEENIAEEKPEEETLEQKPELEEAAEEESAKEEKEEEIIEEEKEEEAKEEERETKKESIEETVEIQQKLDEAIEEAKAEPAHVIKQGPSKHEVHIPKEHIREQRKEEKIEKAAEAEKEKYEEGKEDEEDRSDEEAEEAHKKKGFFARLKETFTTVKLSEEKFEKLFWELEVAMLENNVAVEVIEKIKEDLKQALTTGRISRKEVGELIHDSLKESIQELFIDSDLNIIDEIRKKKDKPYIIAFIGVNGSGKTTTMAKIAHLLQKNKISLVFAASDTFRAAAIQQLQEHADNLGIKMIKHDYESDPAAVAFDAVKHAKAKGIDAVLIDTAGRLHSNDNLMNELKKLVRVNKPDMKIFIGESITGNDCVEQAKLFNEAVGIDAIVLAKADVDEKGGAAISVSYVTQKPIIFLGTGQKYDDLTEFKPELVINNIGL